MLKSKKTVAAVTASLAKMITDLNDVAAAQAAEAERQDDISRLAIARMNHAYEECGKAKQVAAKIEALLN